MGLIQFIETLALLAAGWFVWRRSGREASRPDGARAGRAFGVIVLALSLHILLNLAAEAYFVWVRGGAPDSAPGRFAFALLVIQVARALLLVWALRAWMVLARPRLVRSWRGWMILVCMLFVAFVPDSTPAFVILMIVPTLRLHWTSRVHGWGRAGLVIAFGVITFALITRVDVTTTQNDVLHVSASFGGSETMTQVDGDLGQPEATLMAIARPWEHAIRVMLVLLRLQIAIAFFQLLVVPIRLRGLSIKRRFTVTLAMYRFIPGTLALIFMVLIVYLAIGLHRASVVRHSFEHTLDDALRAASTVMSRGTTPTPSVLHAGEERYAVIRDLEFAAQPGDTTETKRWIERARASSPGTPPALLAPTQSDSVLADSTVGLAEAGGRLYLRAVRVRRDETAGAAWEVYAAVDSLYLARIAEDIRSDIRVDVLPTLFIGRSTVSIGGADDEAWTHDAFTVEAPYPREKRDGGLLEHTVYLARTFIPVGNWNTFMHEGNRIGAIQLKLYTTPLALFESLTDNSTMLASQVFAIIILVGIALLFLIVELSAVRTGRSIIKGIVTDLKKLTEAAHKFGQGDLGHRVALEGHDEMGQLAATFNRMAENIEAHQEILVEKRRLEADLALAREIQQRMLPQSPPVIPGLDIAGLSIPSREVGGDLFYFLPVSGGRLGLTIGDVSGKSVPAALLMSNVLAALKSEARIVDKEDEILEHLNRLIVEQVEPGRFVTFFYCVVDPHRQALRYACAGHNPPLLMRRSGEVEWLQEAGMPLGVLAESTYAPYEVPLRAGDVLVLYSDGVTEAQRAAAGTSDTDEEGAAQTEFFDEHRLEEAVRGARNRTAAGIVSAIMDAIHHFTAGAEAADDITLVVVRMSPASSIE